MLTQQTLTEAIEERCQVCHAVVWRSAVLYEPATCVDCDAAARELGVAGDGLYLPVLAQLAVLRYRLAAAEGRG